MEEPAILGVDLDQHRPEAPPVGSVIPGGFDQDLGGSKGSELHRAPASVRVTCCVAPTAEADVKVILSIRRESVEVVVVQGTGSDRFVATLEAVLAGGVDFGEVAIRDVGRGLELDEDVAWVDVEEWRGVRR